MLAKLMYYSISKNNLDFAIINQSIKPTCYLSFMHFFKVIIFGRELWSKAKYNRLQ